VSLAASACGGKGNQFAEVCDKRKNKSSGNYDKVEITTNILTGRGEPALSAPTRGHSDFRAGGHNWNGQLGNGAIWYSLLPITILLEPNAPVTGDIDGDGLADLISVVGSNWYFWLASSGYSQMIGPCPLIAP